MTIKEKDNLTMTMNTAGLPERLPVMALLVLALAGFITILTEVLPAGLLPQISAGLAVSESLAGQLVTIYAIGSLVAAIPLVAATQAMRRRPLLIAAIIGFAIANTVTTFSSSYVLTMAARFLAGVAAGLLWALLAGYAARMVSDPLKGRAIAVAMVGAPLALSLGVPAGTLIGSWVGWRTCFAIISVLSLLLIVLIRVKVPDFAGQATGKRLPLPKVFILPGIRVVLFVVLAFVLAHNILYTYIAPFLATVDMAERIDLILLVFGITSVISIWIIGVFIDRYLRVLTLGCVILFAVASLMLGIAGNIPEVVYCSVGVWGLAFGGAATLFQTALAKAAGEAADVAQSMLVTVWNLAIAGGGIMGGVLLERVDAGAFSPVLFVLMTMTLAVVWGSRRHAFPAS